MKIRYFLLSFVVMIMLFDSCSTESATSYRQKADMEISKYLIDNNIDAIPNPSGLVFIPIQEGIGNSPEIGMKVAVHYTGYFLDGSVFESTREKAYPIVFELGKGYIIKGWEEAMLLMKKGSKAKIIVPYYLAYGDEIIGDIPAYSNLLFEIELIDYMINTDD